MSLIIDVFRLKALEIIIYRLLGEDAPKFVELSSEHKTKIFVCSMDEVLQYCEQTVNCFVTERGVHRLNQCFRVQKKGGNRKLAKIGKDDLQHGVNKFLVKMTPSVLVSKLNPIAVLDY